MNSTPPRTIASCRRRDGCKRDPQPKLSSTIHPIPNKGVREYRSDYGRLLITVPSLPKTRYRWVLPASYGAPDLGERWQVWRGIRTALRACSQVVTFSGVFTANLIPTPQPDT